MNKKLSFQILDLKEESAIISYRNGVKAIQPNNPFSSLELIISNENIKENLFCFILKEDEFPLVVMPFTKTKIEQSVFDVDFYDVSSPYGYSGPFYNKDINDTRLRYFWEEVDLWYQKNNIVSEFIRFSLNYNYRCHTGHLHPTLLNVRGVLNTTDEVWDSFKPKVRNNVRKAQTENLECKIFFKNITSEAIREFYTIYIATMTRNKAQKKYFFSCDYFQVFINKNAEHCALALIYKDGIPISTELVLLSDDTLYSHLGGTDASYFASRPNDFLKFEVMKWAMEQKKKYYILGGGREIGDDLYKYKKNYFPNDDDIIYYTGRKIILSEVSKILNEYQKLNNFELYSANVENDYFPAYRIK